MLKFYYSLAPNPKKVALFLEEAGLPYEAIPVDTRKGEQHTAEFTAINPNAKVPAIVDGDTTVFDSSAILLYLAEKTGRFLSKPESRGEMLSWLMFTASGIGPFTGQCVHFKRYAPEPDAYALNRYDYEAWRHWRLIEQRLAVRSWMLDEAYTLLDMAVWGWAKALPFALRRRDRRSAGRAAGHGHQGPLRLQDRDGRDGAARNVSAERAAQRAAAHAIAC